MTEGQRLARRQLLSVQAARPGGLEILEMIEPADPAGDLLVEVSVDCAGVESRSGGIRLRPRERLLILVPPRFPLKKPLVATLHRRWRGTPHVQWGYSICLYASTATEWDPSDGMFGFLERLWEWLQAAAAGELDPDGVPLHPPVAYFTPGTPLVIPRVDTPHVAAAPWLGWAETSQVRERRVDLTGWVPLRVDGKLQGAPASAAPSVLIPSALDWEYPDRAVKLLVDLADRGVDWSDLWTLLEFAAFRRPTEPVLMVVGTAMRGTRDQPAQHLTAWQLPAETTGDLWRSLGRHVDRADVREYGEQARQRVMDWAKSAPTAWCSVREARPEVTVRRDQGSPMSWFAGRTVSLWGCGAIGSVVAEWLVRAGVRRIVLRDSAGVAPGVLVRQNFVDLDLGYRKAEALAERLRAVAPHVIAEPHYGNVLDGPLGDGPWHDDTELVIDATASLAVATGLERARSADPSAPLVSLLFGHTAEHGMAVLCAGDAGPLDAMRGVKLRCCTQRGLRRFADEFWPEPPRTTYFQPEPGCSDPTFTGSAVESAALAATLLRAVARDLSNGADVAQLVALDGADGAGPVQHRLELSSAFAIEMPGEVRLRMSPDALDAMQKEIASSASVRGAAGETGGLLFGERDDAAGVLWVTEATGPPPDSQHAPEEFLCGTRGVKEKVAARRARGRGSLELVGTWHTHPVSAARPSSKDINGMAELLVAADSPLAQALLLIVGHAAGPRATLGGYIFERTALVDNLIEYRGAQRRLTKAIWSLRPLGIGESRRASPYSRRRRRSAAS